MGDWYNKFEKKALDDIKDCKGADLRFLRVEEYLRNAERIDDLSSSCKICASIKQKIEDHAEGLKNAINTPGKERKELDYIQDEIINHMRKVHGYYPPQYHRYMQSVYWLCGFMGVAFICTKVFPNIQDVIFYSPAFVIGVVIGQIIGGRKDNKVIKQNKQL